MKAKSNRSPKFVFSFGFTLVETITCLVIIAIVAAIAVPALVGYIDSASEKAAVEECRLAVDAAGALGTEHVLETGVVAYSGEDENNIDKAVTADAILARAELTGKGSIDAYSFDPSKNDSEYKQPTYCVNESKKLVISAAAKKTLAKDVSVLAVSVDDSDYTAAQGISLTFMEYTASNGVKVWYYNDGYTASGKGNITDHIHVMKPIAISQDLTCLQDEITVFKCTGEGFDEGCSYSYSTVTAKAYGKHNIKCDDEHTHTCKNVLHGHVIEGGELVDKTYSCNEIVKDPHKWGKTLNQKLSNPDLKNEAVVIDGVFYKDYSEVPQSEKLNGSYKLKICTDCGLKVYEKVEEPTTEPTTEPIPEPTTNIGGSGNWRDAPSSEYNDMENGILFYVTGADNGCWNYDMADENLGPFEAQMYLKNNSQNNKHVKSFELTYVLEYEHAWNHDYDEYIQLSVGGSTLPSDMYTYTVNGNTITVKSTDLFTATALDYQHRTENTLAPGASYKFQINFGRTPSGNLIDLEDKGTNFKIENCNVEFVQSFATGIRINYHGDPTAITRVEYNTNSVMLSDKDGNEIAGNGSIIPSGNPISFYLLPGNQAADSDISLRLFGNDSNNLVHTITFKRKDMVANAGGYLEFDVSALDFGLDINYPYPEMLKFVSSVKVSGAGVNKTANVDSIPSSGLIKTVGGLIPSGSSSDNLAVEVLDENGVAIGKAEITADTWKQYLSSPGKYSVDVLPTGFVLDVKTQITDTEQIGDITHADLKISGVKDSITEENILLNGGSIELLTAPDEGSEKVTLTLKSGGDVIAKKEIAVSDLVLGAANEIIITNDDIHVAPVIPDPDADKMNFNIMFDGDLADEVKYIEVTGPATLNTEISDTAQLVVVNYKPENYNEYWHPDIYITLKDANGNAIGKATISGDDWKDKLGKTIDVSITPSALKLKFNLPDGVSESDVAIVILGGAVGYRSTTLNDLYSGCVSVDVNNHSSITAELRNSSWGLIGTAEISYETWSEALGSILEIDIK